MFVDKARERLLPWVSRVRKKLRDQSAQLLLGDFVKRFLGRGLPLSEEFREIEFIVLLVANGLLSSFPRFAGLVQDSQSTSCGSKDNERHPVFCFITEKSRFRHSRRVFRHRSVSGGGMVPDGSAFSYRPGRD